MFHAKRHYARYHDQSMLNYKCDLCDFAFYGLNALKNHKQIHLNELECGKCSFRTKYPKTLAKHIEKECQSLMKECEKCGQLFPNARSLRRHDEKVHGIVYKCDLCFKKFYSIETKNLHRKNDHRSVRYF